MSPPSLQVAVERQSNKQANVPVLIIFDPFASIGGVIFN